MNIVIRDASEHDYARLCVIFAQVDALHAEALPGIFRKVSGPLRTREFILQMILDEDTALLVADAGSEIVGLVHATIRQTPDYPMVVPRTYAQIAEMAVKEGFRRWGIGQKLMEEAHPCANDKGISELGLNV